MPQINIIDAHGETHRITATSGQTLMLVARLHGIAGIIGDCGGGGVCATCHVHIAPDWTGRIGPADDEEQTVLEFARNVLPQSRLACQIRLTEEHDGLCVRVAP